MPEYYPVEYDPFAPVPVDHDPWDGHPDPFAYQAQKIELDPYEMERAQAYHAWRAQASPEEKQDDLDAQVARAQKWHPSGYAEGEVMPPTPSRRAGYDAYNAEVEAAQGQPGREQELSNALGMRGYGSTIPTVEAQQNAMWGQPISDRQYSEPVNDPFADTAGANAAWVQPGDHTYNTPLAPAQETQFRGWLQQNNVPFNPNAGVTDYDMRGFWQGVQTGNPHAQTEINKNDQRLHYGDWWKTPYHQSFSRGSQWATPNAPYWANDHQLVDQYGNVLFDEQARRPQAIPTRGM